MKFADFVCFEASVNDLAASERDEAIAELIDSLVKAGKVDKKLQNQITKAVVERENEASTGMGKGVAIPHVKHKEVKNVIAVIGRSNKGIDFASLDKQPVYSVILILSPNSDPDKHLKAMENIFRNLQQEKFRKFLRNAETPTQIKELLNEADENPDFY